MPDHFDWRDAYADKVITPEIAAAAVRSGDRVNCGIAEPVAFLEALGARADLEDVTLFVPAPRRGGVAAASNPGVTLLAPFVSQIFRQAGPGSAPRWFHSDSRTGPPTSGGTRPASRSCRWPPLWPTARSGPDRSWAAMPPWSIGLEDPTILSSAW